MQLRNAIIRLLRLLDRLDPNCDSMTEEDLDALGVLRRAVSGFVPGSDSYREMLSRFLVRGDWLL